jgi:hypothetical protein
MYKILGRNQFYRQVGTKLDVSFYVILFRHIL